MNKQSSALGVLSQFICSTTYDTLSNRAVHNIKNAIIDSWGVLLAARNSNTASSFKTYINMCSTKGQYTVPGLSSTFSMTEAAFITATMLHCLDLDDTGGRTQSHPSALTFPALYVCSQNRSTSGKKFISAYAVAIEVLSRLSIALPMLHMRGFHPSGIFGPISVAATVAHLCDFTVEDTIHSLAIACSSSSGIIANFGTQTKSLHIGNAVSSGIRAALLSKSGFRGSENVLDCEGGFLEVFSDDNSRAIGLECLGKRFAVEDPGLNIKRHSACGSAHRIIDATLLLRKQITSVESEQIEKIQIFTTPRAKAILRFSIPNTPLEAQFSLPYLVSVALLKGDLSIEHFTEETIADQRIQHLMSKVETEVHLDWSDGQDSRPDKVIITMNNSKQFTEEVAIPMGHAQNPFTQNEIEGKFLTCTKNVLLPQQQETFLHAIENLESAEDCFNLFIS